MEVAIVRLIAQLNGRIYRGTLPDGAESLSFVDEYGARTLRNGRLLIDGQEAAPGQYTYPAEMADGTVQDVTIDVAADGTAAVVSITTQEVTP